MKPSKEAIEAAYNAFCSSTRSMMRVQQTASNLPGMEAALAAAMPHIEAMLIREIEIFGREAKLSGRKTPLTTNDVSEMLYGRTITPFFDNKSFELHELSVKEIKAIHNSTNTLPLHANPDDKMTGKQQRTMTPEEEKDTKTFYDHIGKQIDAASTNAMEDLVAFVLAEVRLLTLKAAAKCAADYDQDYETGAGADIAKRILNLSTGS